MVELARNDGNDGTPARRVVIPRARPLTFGEKPTGRVEAWGLPQRDQLVGVAALGQHPAVRGRDEDRPAEHQRHLRDQLVETSAVQQDRDEGVVHLLAAFEQRCLPVEHLGEHLVEDVVEPDSVGNCTRGKPRSSATLERLIGKQHRGSG